jgi:hypothetical protein
LEVRAVATSPDKSGGGAPFQATKPATPKPSSRTRTPAVLSRAAALREELERGIMLFTIFLFFNAHVRHASPVNIASLSFCERSFFKARLSSAAWNNGKRRRRDLFVELSRRRPSSSVQERHIRSAEIPPLRGLRLLVPGFYRDVAPTALGNGCQHVGLKFWIMIKIRLVRRKYADENTL